MPKLSIIIPVYNAIATIEKTIASVLAQTFTDFELILVHDCSQDNTLEVLSKVTDHRVRVFHNSINCGAYFSCNVGLYHAKGDYISFIGSDDIVSPWRFQKALEHFSEHPELLYLETRYLRYFNSTGKVRFLWNRGVGVPIFHKTVLEKVGFFLPVRVAGDTEYAERVENFFGEDKIDLVDDFTYWAQIRDESLTSQIPGNSEPRLEMFRQARKAFKTKINLPVEFPFSQSILDEFRHLQIFMGNTPPDLQSIEEITLSKNDEENTIQSSMNLEILNYTEQAVKEYHQQLISAEKKKWLDSTPVRKLRKFVKGLIE